MGLRSVGRYSERWRFRHDEPLSVRGLSIKTIVQQVLVESGVEAARAVERSILSKKKNAAAVAAAEAQDVLDISNRDCFIPLVPRVNNSNLGGEWRAVCSSPWSRFEHISVLETRACVSALCICARRPRCFKSRIIFLSDSLACILSGSKGRSSKPGMFRALRQVAALLIVLGSSLHLHWIASELNDADPPSRRGLRRPERENGSIWERAVRQPEPGLVRGPLRQAPRERRRATASQAPRSPGRAGSGPVAAGAEACQAVRGGEEPGGRLLLRHKEALPRDHRGVLAAGQEAATERPDRHIRSVSSTPAGSGRSGALRL